MRIVIFTSKDHYYSNFILKTLLQKGIFHNHQLFIFEQDSLIPGKSKLSGLIKYIKISGFRYVFWQMLKQYVFFLKKQLALWQNNQNSLYYPYYLIRNTKYIIFRQTLNQIKKRPNVEYFKSIKPDLLISLYSKEIIPLEIIKLPKLGAINLHPALLPYNKGVSPTFWTLANGEKFTGVTLHFLDEGIDTGEIISQTKIPTIGFTTEHSLYLKCCMEGVILLEKFLEQPTAKTLVKKKRLVGSYNSLPTKLAVEQFLKNGYRFF